MCCRPIGLAALMALLVAVLSQPTATCQVPAGFVASYLAEARGELDGGNVAGARATVERALERDAQSLPALQLLAEIARRQDDADTAVHTLHRWLAVFDGRPDRKNVAQRKPVLEQLLPLDSEALSWGKLQSAYVTGLLEIGKSYRGKKDWLGALEVYERLLLVAPDQPEALAAIQQIRSTGGREVAIEDVYAGADPMAGLSEAELHKLDAEHGDWDKAYTDQSDNYRYRTNAGLLVLRTSRIAMEQMNGFYRRFFHFLEDGGKTPAIEIRIFKNRDEYLKLGRNPQPWSAGHFIGDAVETYAGGVSGKASVREMYQTLFHEAAHQFVSMTGPLVPGWLNEAYASFFEGCVILSNGSVKWNRVPPGRLFPLAQRLENGWMNGPGAEPGPGGEWTEPTQAPTFRTIVEGRYQWGPPWYAPTWGVVYFLYNYRLDDGQLVYRDALHTFYASCKRGPAKDPAAHFEEIVLRGSKLSKVQTLAELDPVWRDWILQLRDRETGKLQIGDELLRFAKAALDRGDKDMALEFLEEARERRADDAEVLWQLAALLETLPKKKAQAAARYREFRRALAVRGLGKDPRDAQASKKIEALDPLITRLRSLEQKLGEQGLLLAKDYEARHLPTMALEIVRRMTASFSFQAAMDYYVDLASRTGKSLARWRVAYDERSLQGWSGGDDGAFTAYGKLLRAEVKRDGERMVTRELTCDVTFDADFSLAAELQVLEAPNGGYRGDLVGLCFGRKGDSTFQAVLLHPKGFLDISSNRGGVWTVHDHRSVPVGSSWHQLRIDVTGNQLDVYYDGLFVRSLSFADAAAVRGSFGLLCGPGDAQFRNVRLLERDPFDPAARIERDLAMAKIMSDPGQRTPGTFSGFVPPELGELEFVQGEATTLGAWRQRPVMLVFWSPAQDRVIPCTSYLRHVLERGARKGLAMLVLADPGTKPDELRAYLAEHALPGSLVAVDSVGATYQAFFVKAGFFGIPRIVLLDRDGKVCFEGDPGLRKGQEWRMEDGPTYADAALDVLLGK